MTADPLTADEPPILVFAKYASNAELILAAHKLGYLPPGALVLDATYGEGIFWKKYRPERLVVNSLSPGSAPDVRFDFTRPPFGPGSFDVAVFDPRTSCVSMIRPRSSLAPAGRLVTTSR